MISVIFDDLGEDIAGEILAESFEATQNALHRTGEVLIPEMLRRNFDRQVQSDETTAWLPVSPNSIPIVETIDAGYRRNPDLNQPLVDTGSLMNSAITTQVDVFTIETRLSDYGFPHDEGTATLPEEFGGAPIRGGKTEPRATRVPQREHMFIIDPEDTDVINKVFEEEFRK